MNYSNDKSDSTLSPFGIFAALLTEHNNTKLQGTSKPCGIKICEYAIFHFNQTLHR